ncbi:hypothetical protein L873DRAFT_1820091 [Choiromyces venosus 120613-1]|uniref:Uncharacterized protein n=1 Tax=Choiromyces venosus 120613-1 TaxID=1336337 RepID=A0A3N4J191_9PEZI|nr:hypothetical protein L873DRAFT_1823646 [Choiromyces venosus 120613-1]RPA90987.1 hypothetical protein L873DRAFT_1820091 [Choiromyces venosus 120613-1]
MVQDDGETGILLGSLEEEAEGQFVEPEIDESWGEGICGTITWFVVETCKVNQPFGGNWFVGGCYGRCLYW